LLQYFFNVRMCFRLSWLVTTRHLLNARQIPAYALVLYSPLGTFRRMLQCKPAYTAAAAAATILLLMLLGNL